MANLGEQFKIILDELEREELSRNDVIVPLNELHMDSYGNILIPEMGEYGLGDAAFTQLCGALKMPTTYMKSLMKLEPELVAMQVNLFLNEQRGKRDAVKKVRLKSNRIQGFVGENYVPFDNIDLLSMFDNISNKIPQAEIAYHHLDDRKLHMRLVFPEMAQDFGYDIQGKSDKLFVGFDIENSEIGLRSIQLTPMIWRLVCTNGLRRVVGKGESVKQRHSNFEVSALRDKLIESITNSIDTGFETLNILDKLRAVKVDDIDEKVAEFGKRFKLTQKRIKEVQDNFLFDPEKTMYGVVNAFTRTARDSKSVEQRIELEELTANILKVA